MKNFNFFSSEQNLFYYLMNSFKKFGSAICEFILSLSHLRDLRENFSLIKDDYLLQWIINNSSEAKDYKSFRSWKDYKSFAALPSQLHHKKVRRNFSGLFFLRQLKSKIIFTLLVIIFNEATSMSVKNLHLLVEDLSL